MIFFDEKEDVIDLQLTQYGKYLLSKGKFKPVYYAFFDDDIIYDQRYASGSALEEQNNVENRIFDETPRNKTQYLYHSVDFTTLNELRRTNYEEFLEKIQQTSEKHYATAAPLGNSGLTETVAPAFNIRFVAGTISGSVATISGSGNQLYSTQRIPQINLEDVTYNIQGRSAPSNLSEDTEGADGFRDGSYLDVEESYLLLSVEEENVPVSKDNFDIEVYALDQSGNIEFPLYFSKEPPLIENGILLDPPSVGRQPHIDTDQVDYFFNLWVDGNIPSNVASLLKDEE